MQQMQIQLRHDEAPAWEAVNPVLAAGELGVETDTFRAKFGDGATEWNNLPYLRGTGTEETWAETIEWRNIVGSIAGNAALAGALASKVEAEEGKGLSTEDFTSAEKAKLADCQISSEKGQPGGYAELGSDGKVPASQLDLPGAALLRQLDLAIPGKFAVNVTATALAEAGKDFATWQLEPCALKKIMARAYAADSGAVPASVYLVINGTQVGDAVPVYASSWSEIPVSGVVGTGDAIEIGVSATGTNKNSEGLRLTIVAEAAG